MILHAILLFVAAFGGGGSAYAADTVSFGPQGYYELRPDQRRCAAPLCGGWWLKRVNHPQTMCADHKPKRECYVAELENEPAALWDSEEPIIVRGRIRAREYQGFGNLGYLDVLGAWRAATPDRASGQYGGIESSGIVCITTPCASWDLYLLNKSITRQLTSVDLKPAGASIALEQEAIDLMAEGSVLLVRGVVHQLPTDLGSEFEVRQFYLPIQ